MSRRDLLGWAAAGLLVAAGVVSLAHVSRESSPTWDEMHFWGLGYYLLETGRFDVPGAAAHTPLGFYLAALPLLSRDIPPEIFGPAVRPGEEHLLFAANIERSNTLMERVGFEPFLASRLPFVALYGLLGLAVYRWARRWWGPAGGLFSLALYLLCPTVMSHAYLVTTDFLVAFFLFVALAALVEAIEEPGPAPLVVFVAAFALAPVSKLTGLFVGPLAVAVVLWHGSQAASHEIWVPGHGRRPVGRLGLLAYWAAVGLLACGALYSVLVAVYRGDLGLRVFRIVIGLAWDSVGQGHAVFLDGRFSNHGFAEYYLRAIPYKTPTPILVAWVLGLLVARAGPRRRAASAALLALAVLVAVTLTGYTLGLRFVLVAFPLLAVSSGRLAAVSEPGREARLRLALCSLIVAASLAELASVYPYPRSYMNPVIVRRPKYTALADSDLDWGEGLVALKKYVDARGLPPISLCYHGSAWPKLFGIRTTYYLNPAVGWELGPRPTRGLFFISSTNLSGLYTQREGPARLGRYRPVDVVGGTIYVFDLDRLEPLP